MRQRTEARGAAVRVIVTRPAAQAEEWVAQLRAHRIDAVALPLIDIVAVADRSPIDAAWIALGTQALVVFVSPNAAEQFFAARPPASVWPPRTLAGSPGPGTSRALRSLGVPAGQIVEPAADSAQFDSQSLWLALEGRRAWRGAPVLVVRGDGGREWLADALRSAGADVTTLSAYRRAAPMLGGREHALMQRAFAAPAAWLWFFSSSEAIDHLETLAGPRPPPAWAALAALATHPRIAERARALGSAHVRLARPALADVIACLQSIGP